MFNHGNSDDDPAYNKLKEEKEEKKGSKTPSAPPAPPGLLSQGGYIPKKQIHEHQKSDQGLSFKKTKQAEIKTKKANLETLLQEIKKLDSIEDSKGDSKNIFIFRTSDREFKFIPKYVRN